MESLQHSGALSVLNDDPSKFLEFRAPARHGEALILPTLSEVPQLIESNRAVLETHRSLQSLRASARSQMIADAVRYTLAYRDVDWFDSEESKTAPIMMAGHQPAMFHAGVWFKNFALAHLAKANGAVAVNLVIDNDVASGCSVRVPSVDETTHRAVYRSIPYDDAGGGVPYEQTTIDDRGLFDSFDERVGEAVLPLVEDPCVSRLWVHARRAVERCGVAGCAMAQARHGLEGEIGLRTLELPLGVLCKTTAFAEFVLMILGELPRFQQCYNGAARAYRSAHGIRSSAHPVPDLAVEGEWFEAPLWIYGNDAPQRKAAWAKLRDDELIISDLGEREIRVDLRFPKLAAEKLVSMLGPNFKLRPRALLTTMYARLVLSDVFIHGIGGGKYDQLSDAIIQSFFMLTPPKFMVISATVLLPGVNRDDGASQRIRDLQRAIRDTQYQPERFSDRVELDAKLVEEKRRLLANVPVRGERQEWHHELERVNEELSKPLHDLRSQFRLDLAAERQRLASDAVLTSREHPFCVFPIDYLTQVYSRLLKT